MPQSYCPKEQPSTNERQENGRLKKTNKLQFSFHSWDNSKVCSAQTESSPCKMKLQFPSEGWLHTIFFFRFPYFFLFSLPQSLTSVSCDPFPGRPFVLECLSQGLLLGEPKSRVTQLESGANLNSASLDLDPVLLTIVCKF